MAVVHSIGIAGIKVVSRPDQIRTVLGSCIGIALFDRVAKIGGLAHVILPSSPLGVGAAGKFADTAIDQLIDDLVTAGVERKRIKAKITGGAFMFGSINNTNIGERNAIAVKERLRHHHITLLAEDVGGEKGRKMTLDPASGDVTVQIIGAEPKTI